jgi:hypothetical protein
MLIHQIGRLTDEFISLGEIIISRNYEATAHKIHFVVIIRLMNV